MTQSSIHELLPPQLAGHTRVSPGLAGYWIELPQVARSEALSRTLTRGLCPSHIGFFPNFGRHHVRRASGVEEAIFIHCVQGEGWCELAGRRFRIVKGDLLMLPPSLPHAYGSSQRRPWTIHWFHALGAHLPLLLAELNFSVEQPVAHLGADPQLLGLFDELRQALEGDPTEPRVLFSSQVLQHLMGVMIRLRHRRVELKSAEQRVRDNIELIRRHQNKQFDVAALAGAAGLSPSRYSLLFRQLTGQTPKSYQTRMKVERAAELLCSSDLSIKAIAALLGYTDPLHFSRVFRRHLALSPRAYRLLRPGVAEPEAGTRALP